MEARRRCKTIPIWVGSARRAQFVKARMRARRNACRASARQRAASPLVTEKATNALPCRRKKIFCNSAGSSADLGRSGISLAMIRKMTHNGQRF
jgi:hypothetical protein